ncbi:MAG: hypothetical protein KJO69_11505, partial [Gammaproteobacteria bacterium]|nr:hypothetical protein [Gammaproteobacteria bacterium]
MQYKKSHRASLRSNLISLILGLLLLVVMSGCGGSNSNGNPPSQQESIIVNSLLDEDPATAGVVTLRAALANAQPGQRITFDQNLNGETINLTFIDTQHTVLTGEVMGFDDANNISYLVGYYNRDYGKSALFSDKDVFLDASNLSDGITINWQGTDSARVLAVAGDLYLNNVSITGGHSLFDVAIDVGQHSDDQQIATLARGAGLAVWG